MPNSPVKRVGLLVTLRQFGNRILSGFDTPGYRAAVSNTKLDTCSVISVTALFVVTAWFSQATFAFHSATSSQTGIWGALGLLGISDTLAILQVLQSLLTTASLALLLNSFDILTWILTKRDTGIRTLRLLGFSSVTGLWGTLGLLFSHHTSTSDKALIAVKLGLLAATWLSGVVLFAKTEIVVVNQSISSYNVTAGIGSFKGAYVSEFLQQLQETNAGYNQTILPYSIIRTSSQLTINPRHSLKTPPVTCNKTLGCDSYLLPGGLAMSTPWPPTDHADHPLITIHSAPATQIDFERDQEQDQSFDVAQDCLAFGSQGFLVGMQFCLAKSKSKPNSLAAGLFVCTQGAEHGECVTKTNPPKLLTTFTAYQRHATVTSARDHMTMTAIRDVSAPVHQDNVSVDALKLAFSWLFNSTAEGIPMPSSVTQYFWSMQDQLDNDYWSMEAYQMFQSLLAFPFWHFNENNYGNVRLQSDTMVTSLPAEFYTFATVEKPMSKISIDRGMFITFCILQVICISCLWSALICQWIYHHGMPTKSSYPIIDFTMKTQQRCDPQASKLIKATASPTGDGGIIDRYADDNLIRQLLKDEYTVLRNIGSK